jgi:neutral ceramidase
LRGGPNGTLQAPHRLGPVDQPLSILVFQGDSGALAALWSVGCHPVCSPHYNSVSADFVGIVRDHIRLRFGPIPVCFFQGFSGDVRPLLTTRAPGKSAKELAKWVVARGHRFCNVTPSQFSQWGRDLTRVVDRAIDSMAPFSIEPDKINTRDASVEILKAERSLNGMKVSLGPVDLVGIGAEVPALRAHELRAAYGSRIVIPTGCVNSMIGYLPTSEMLREGGYEGVSSCRFFPALQWGDVTTPDKAWQSLTDLLDLNTMSRSL